MKFPTALTHVNCYRADGRCLMTMLPVLDGEGRLSLASRRELTQALAERYAGSTRSQKQQILEEFTKVRRSPDFIECTPSGCSTTPYVSRLGVGMAGARSCVQRNCSRGIDRALGGRRPDLWQAAQADHASASGSHVSTSSSQPGSGSSIAASGDECGHDGSSSPADSRAEQDGAPSAHGLHCTTQEHSHSNFWWLE